MEIKKQKFTFTILNPDDKTKLYAEGEMKLEKAGPFKTIVFFNIKAGEFPCDISSIDDSYTAIYRLADDTWMLAANFDKERNQKPSLDVYRKSK